MSLAVGYGYQILAIGEMEEDVNFIGLEHNIDIYSSPLVQ